MGSGDGVCIGEMERCFSYLLEIIGGGILTHKGKSLVCMQSWQVVVDSCCSSCCTTISADIMSIGINDPQARPLHLPSTFLFLHFCPNLSIRWRWWLC